MDKLLKYNGVQEALKFLREDDERTLQEHLEMCQIPAPSYEEGEKAEYVRKKMVDAGLSDVHIDEVGNVLGTWKGTGNGCGTYRHRFPKGDRPCFEERRRTL